MLKQIASHLVFILLIRVESFCGVEGSPHPSKAVDAKVEGEKKLMTTLIRLSHLIVTFGYFSQKAYTGTQLGGFSASSP